MPAISSPNIGCLNKTRRDGAKNEVIVRVRLRYDIYQSRFVIMGQSVRPVL